MFSSSNAQERPPIPEKWWDSSTIAVVTGGNKGIGFEICKQLAEQGVTTILAARNVELGTAAIDKLKEAGVTNVEFQQMDISDLQSVKSFADRVKSTHGQINILVNNAGMAYKGSIFGAEEAKRTINVNYTGTRQVCEHLSPLIVEGGNVVNVCSRAGLLRIIPSDQVRSRFENATSPQEIDTLASEFLEGIKDNTFHKQGWPSSMYGVSKVCEATYTRILADQMKAKSISVNACCPGYVATDMSSWRGTKSAPEGADTPVWLALQTPKQGPTGLFYAERQEINF